MAKRKIIHLIEHHCYFSDDCECSVLCRNQGEEIEATKNPSHVTCKNCLRSIAGRHARRESQEKH